MYWRDKWSFNNSNEYEFKWVGKYGAKGEKRAKKKKATPEQIKKQNQANKEKKMKRLIKANFTEGDYWLTLKYPKGTRKDLEEVKKDLKKFISNMRRQYAKENEVFKFIYRMEIGARGGIHIHMIVPRIRGSDTDSIIQKGWKEGRVNFQTLDDGEYTLLASYITKPPDEEVEKQLSLFPEEEQKQLIKYSTSRNLVRPEPERKTYSKWTVRKLIEEGPKPTPGYYIVKESIRMGVNQYTNMSYLHYTERKVESG